MNTVCGFIIYTYKYPLVYLTISSGSIIIFVRIFFNVISCVYSTALETCGLKSVRIVINVHTCKVHV